MLFLADGIHALVFNFVFKFPDRLKLALTRASQDCDHLRKKCLSVSSATPTTPGTPFTQMDVTPTIPTSSFFGQAPNTTFGLKVSYLFLL